MMRNLCLGMVLLAGCFGDDLTLGDPEVAPPTRNPTETVIDPGAARLLADVCETKTYPGVVTEANDLDVAVVPMRDGAAVLSVAKSGGALRGFRIDPRGELAGDPAGTVLRDDQPYSAVSATVLDDRLVVAAVANKNVSLDMVRDDLGAKVELATFAGSVVGKLPFAHARNARVNLIGGADGISETTFDASWTPIASQQVAKSSPVTMSAATYQDDVMVAWSTEKSCSVARVAAGVTTSRDFACPGARLVATSTGGTLVYEDDEGNVVRSHIVVGGESEIADRSPLAKFATAPRIVSDGTRDWASYIDVHGDVVVGYIDESGVLVSRALEGTRPLPDAYELAVFDNSVWVVAAAEQGFTAHRMCLVPSR